MTNIIRYAIILLGTMCHEIYLFFCIYYVSRSLVEDSSEIAKIYANKVAVLFAKIGIIKPQLLGFCGGKYS